MQFPVIQIAGIRNVREGRLLARCGATHAGFPLRLPVNRPDVSETEARDIIARLPDSLTPVLITYLDRSEEVAAFCRQMNCFTIQLHAPVAVDQLKKIKGLCPRISVWKSLVTGENSLSELEKILSDTAPWVDAFITDTFDPVTGASGATGKTHDWRLSRRLVERSPRPVILAGGLTPENVAAGIAATGCAGVDAHTGVEGPDGRKQENRVKAFVRNARQAFGSTDN